MPLPSFKFIKTLLLFKMSQKKSNYVCADCLEPCFPPSLKFVPEFKCQKCQKWHLLLVKLFALVDLYCSTHFSVPGLSIVGLRCCRTLKQILISPCRSGLRVASAKSTKNGWTHSPVPGFGCCTEMFQQLKVRLRCSRTRRLKSRRQLLQVQACLRVIVIKSNINIMATLTMMIRCPGACSIICQCFVVGPTWGMKACMHCSCIDNVVGYHLRMGVAHYIV